MRCRAPTFSYNTGLAEHSIHDEFCVYAAHLFDGHLYETSGERRSCPAQNIKLHSVKALRDVPRTKLISA